MINTFKVVVTVLNAAKAAAKQSLNIFRVENPVLS